MPGGKVGGKLSKQVLFEDINFKLYNDGDKTMAFMTARQNQTPNYGLNVSMITGAPNGNFRENICSEDDLRSRI